jgi:hypothetical protein
MITAAIREHSRMGGIVIPPLIKMSSITIVSLKRDMYF